MKAIQVQQFGGPEVLRLKEIPRPQINADDVLVKVYASGVNPIDWKIRQGYTKHHLPFTPGWDVAGTVEEAGITVKDLRKGDAVYGKPDTLRNGSYAEFIAVRAGELGHKPKSADFVTAAGIPLAGLTAWQGLFEHGGLRQGQKILIHGGAGGVGTFAIQFARWKGAHVIATGSEDNLLFLRDMGAQEAIDYHQPGFGNNIQDLDMVFDLVGGNAQKHSLPMLKPGGILVTTLKIEDQESFQENGVRITGMLTQSRKEDLEMIAQLVDSGNIKPVIAKIFPLEQAAEASRLSQEGHVRGKLILKVREELD